MAFNRFVLLWLPVLLFCMWNSTAFGFSATNTLGDPSQNNTTLSDTACDQLHTQMIEAYSQRSRSPYGDRQQTPALLRRITKLAHETRACLRAARVDTGERIFETYWTEVFALRELERHSEALQMYRSFFQNYAQRVSQEHLAKMHESRGFLYYQLGNLVEAAGDYTRAVEIAESDSTEPGRYRRLLLNTASIFHAIGAEEATLDYYTRAARMLESESEDPDRRDLIDVYTNKALYADRPEKAVASARRAATLARTRYRETPSGPSADYLVRSTATLARMLIADGRADASLRELQQVRGYLDEAGQGSELNYLQSLVITHLHRNQPVEAARAVRAYRDRADALRSLPHQAEARLLSGFTAEVQRDWAQAADAYRASIQHLERLRESLRATQWASTGASEWLRAYRRLVHVHIQQGRPAEAFQTLYHSRARHLSDLRIEAQVSRELPIQKRATFDSLTTELVNTRNALATDTLRPPARQTLQTREDRLIAERRSLLDLRVPEPVPLDAIQRALRAGGRVLLSYALPTSSSQDLPSLSNEALAFIVTADSLHVRRLPEVQPDSVQAVIESISPLFANAGKVESIDATRFDLRPLHALHQQLVAPVADLIPDGAPLTIVPDGPLFHLPFSALVTTPPDGPFSYGTASFLIKERPLTIEISASLLADTTRTASSSPKRPQTRGVTAFGLSTFDSLRTVPASLRAGLPEAMRTQSTLQLPSLPGVVDELNAIRHLIDRSRVELDETATERRFHTLDMDTPVLHIASHAFVHPVSPLYNAFLLRPGGGSGSESDGFLFLHELKTRSRPIPLVVLSGCSTARGAIRSGEGMEGLQYGFRAMGAQATISNLWPAHDRAAVDLTRLFYQHLKDGLRKDEALRRSQLDYMERFPHMQSPFFWGTSALYGSPDPIPLARASLPTWVRAEGLWFGGLGALLAVLFAGWFAWRHQIGRNGAWAQGQKSVDAS